MDAQQVPIDPNTLPWWLTSLVYVAGTVVYRFQKVLGWCSVQDIAAKKAGQPRLTYRAGMTTYWVEHRFIIVYDFIAQSAVGLAWAAGLLSEILGAVGISFPEKPNGLVWFPLVFFVAFALSAVLSERLKNMMLKKIDLVAPGPEGESRD
jgi:hypothetical protein